MFCLLTKKGKSSWDLPIRWKGKNANARLCEELGYAVAQNLFSGIFSPDDRAAHGIFPWVEAPKKVGQIKTVTGESFDGLSVTETADYSPDPDYVEPDPVADLVASHTRAIKDEANRRILEIVPEWRQRNLTAQAAQLAEKGRANWTAEEVAAWDAGLAVWAEVKAIRDRSDLLESALGSKSLEQLQSYDPSLDSEWA